MVCDVLGMGYASVDDLLYVRAYPPADAKIQVLRTERHCGGLTATALVAAARLGSSCTYAGTLGHDELSRYVLGRMAGEGVDISHTVFRGDARPVHSVIIVDETNETRNIFFDLNGVVGADAELPDSEVIRGARVLFVDHGGCKGMIRAAKIARDAGIPVVADVERDRDPDMPELMGLIDHLIVSCGFAARITGGRGAAEAVRALWQPGRRAVVVTCGAEGCWYTCGAAEPPRHQPAYKVNVCDTTGCGDVFHGAYASALARGVPPEERIRFASAAAALKATRPGGQDGIPTRPAVEHFIAERG